MSEASRFTAPQASGKMEPASPAGQRAFTDESAFFGPPARVARLPAGTAYTQTAVPEERAAPAPAAGSAPRPTLPTPPALSPPQSPVPSPTTPATAVGPPSAERGRQLAATVVGTILQRLSTEAARQGGSLSIADIEALRLEFEGKIGALQKVFEQSFEDYVKVRERAAQEQARRYPFDRLIVQRFAPVFTSDGGPSFAEGGLSRRMLPGFFMAMNMLLGHDIIDVYQEQCRRLVARVKAAHGNRLDWADVHADDEARTLTNDAMVTMAPHFEDLRRRGTWMVELINGHLAPPDVAREGAGVENWQLSERGYILLLDALYSDIREKMQTETGRLRLTRAYGGDTVAAIAELLKRLDQALAHGLRLKV